MYIKSKHKLWTYPKMSIIYVIYKCEPISTHYPTLVKKKWIFLSHTILTHFCMLRGQISQATFQNSKSDLGNLTSSKPYFTVYRYTVSFLIRKKTEFISCRVRTWRAFVCYVFRILKVNWATWHPQQQALIYSLHLFLSVIIPNLSVPGSFGTVGNRWELPPVTKKTDRSVPEVTSGDISVRGAFLLTQMSLNWWSYICVNGKTLDHADEQWRRLIVAK